MKALALVLLVSISAGCMRTMNPRFVRHQVPVSRWCDVTLIRDLRTGVCWVSYDCKWAAGINGLAVAPKEVCQP